MFFDVGSIDLCVKCLTERGLGVGECVCTEEEKAFFLEDRIHPASGKLISAKPVRTKPKGGFEFL